MAIAALKAPKPVIFMVASFLCPTELSLYLDGLRLPPHRVALLLLVPIALWKLFFGRGLKIRSFDVFFLFYSIWTVAIYMHTAGQHEGLVYGGSLALESLGAYLVARVWIRDIDTFRSTLKMMAMAIIIAALFALPEFVGGKFFTHDFLREMIGGDPMPPTEQRLGFTRATSVFDHPIHYGTFCAALLALFWFSEKRAVSRKKKAALLGSATLLGLSSAPLLCIGLQASMLTWERLTRGIASRTALTMVVLFGLYIGASLVATRSPIAFIATGMTLDSWTGYYRLQIWENGLESVWENPWTGIGLADWKRPWWMISSTVDAFWLVTMMRAGLPAFFLMMIAIVLQGKAVKNRGMTSRDSDIRRLAMGWTMSIIALSLIATTVHFWNVLHAYFFFILGLGAWMADPARVKAAVKSKIPAAHRSQPGPQPAPQRPVYRPELPPRPAYMPAYMPPCATPLPLGY